MKALTRIFVLCGVALLGGCASMGNVTSGVTSYGEWPTGRLPGTYAFERLPSQQARAAESAALEAAARPALAKAGFQPVEGGKDPDVLVQVGALEDPVDVPVWDDPIWWRGGFGWHHGGWGSPVWGGPYWGGAYYYYRSPRYERAVAVLIRDRASGKPLYESHASTETVSSGDGKLLEALFDAALFDFPHLGMNPRSVVVPLPQ